MGMVLQFHSVCMANRCSTYLTCATCLLGLVLGCVSSPPQPEATLVAESTARGDEDTNSAPVTVPHGAVQIDITDIVGNDLHAKIELREKAEEGRGPIVFDLPDGRATERASCGTYGAYVYVYDQGIPILVDVQELAIAESDTAFLLVNLLEGTSGNRPLRAFDQDGDGALDRVEVSCGTDPVDASSIPGQELLPFSGRVLSQEAKWYRGELHAHSVYGGGRETVGQLIKRAEKLGLDFLAITDRNTMAACMDPEFHSDTVVLIPAMEWGSDEMGVALIYGPRTFPAQAETVAHAQALANRVQAQLALAVGHSLCKRHRGVVPGMAGSAADGAGTTQRGLD